MSGCSRSDACVCLVSRAVPRREEPQVAQDDIDTEELDDEIELEVDDLELDGDEILEDDEIIDEDDEIIDEDDDFADDADESDDGISTEKPAAKKGDEDDDDDDMVAPDDVEEDLAEILKDRLASEQVAAEGEEAEEPEEKSSGEDALQPKRADEILCSSCFLLVRQGAPVCPVGDDACPVFTS